MAVSEAAIRRRLQKVLDPEIGLDIITLGLVYRIQVRGKAVQVQMLLTTPACPLTGYFSRTIERALRDIEGVENAAVEFLLDPPWTPERIAKDARLTIGLL